jgi:hypothetical protein
MKQSILIIAAFVIFQLSAVAQTSSFSGLSNTETTSTYNLIAPNSLLNHSEKDRSKSKNGVFNILIGGYGTKVNDNYKLGGQVDVLLNLGKKVSIGAMASTHTIGEEQLTPVIPYARLNLLKRVAIQGGYGWYMNDYDYNFTDANQGYYGALVLGGSRLSLELGGYFPKDQDRQLKAGLRMRLFKL